MSPRDRLFAAPRRLIPAALVGLAFISACSKEEPPAAAEAKRVKAVVVKAVALPDEVSGFGSLSFLKKVDLAAPQDAVIRTLPYREGDRVRAGAVVVRLSNPHIELAVGQAENAVEQAEAALRLAQARLADGELSAEARLLEIDKAVLEIAQARRELSESERKQTDQETLFAAGGVNEETIRSGRFSIESAKERVALMERDLEIQRIGFRDEDLLARGIALPRDPQAKKRALIAMTVSALSAEKASAEAQLNAAQQELKSARLTLVELTITAPTSGVVGARYFEEGERVKRDDKIVTLMDVGSLYAIAPIREAEAVRLSEGMKARVDVDAAKASFDGIVDLVSPIADTQSASFTVRVRIPDPPERLKPGMFARVTVIAGVPRRALVVPEGALLDRSGGAARVFVVTNGMAVNREIAVEASTDSGRVVLSGLSEGEVVVDKPDPTLKEGDRVAVSD